MLTTHWFSNPPTFSAAAVFLNHTFIFLASSISTALYLPVAVVNGSSTPSFTIVRDHLIHSDQLFVRIYQRRRSGLGPEFVKSVSWSRALVKHIISFQQNCWIIFWVLFSEYLKSYTTVAVKKKKGSIILVEMNPGSLNACLGRGGQQQAVL